MEAAPTARRALPPAWSSWLVFVLVAAVAWFALSRNIDWPYYDQPDEVGKARQVIKRAYNHHHPMLMLISAERAVKVLREVGDFKRNYQSITEVGRAVVGLWISLGLAAMATLAWRRLGWLAVVLVLLAALGDTTNYERAHYFKEDGVLLGTFGLSVLLFDLWLRRRQDGEPDQAQWPLLIPFALCLGLVAASKYIGALMFLPGLLLLALNLPKRQRARVVFAALGLAILGFLIGNYRTVLEPQNAWSGVNYEFDSLAQGSHGVRSAERESLPNWHPLRLFNTFMPWWVWLPVLLLPLLLRWRALALPRATIWLAWSFPLLVMLSLLGTYKFANRYLAPPIWGTTLLLALLVAALIHIALKHPRRPLRLATALLALFLSLSLANQQWGWLRIPGQSRRPTTLELHQAYAQNKNNRLPALLASLPEGSVVVNMGRRFAPPANDEKPPPGYRGPVVYYSAKAPDDPTLATLRNLQSTHLLFPMEYHRVYEGEMVGSEAGLERNRRRRDFWRQAIAASDFVDEQPVSESTGLSLDGWELRRMDWSRVPTNPTSADPSPTPEPEPSEPAADASATGTEEGELLMEPNSDADLGDEAAELPR